MFHEQKKCTCSVLKGCAIITKSVKHTHSSTRGSLQRRQKGSLLVLKRSRV